MKYDNQPEPVHGISPDMSVNEALRMAIAFEQAAMVFYRGLADRVHPEARPLILELADEEQKHAELLQGIPVAGKFGHILNQRHTIPPTQLRFNDFINLYELSEGASEDEILNYVESRERIAFEHYGHLAELTPPGPLQDLFIMLREEERQHESDIQSRWSTMFSIF